MELPIYQVDAFTSRLFGGNPAAICPLEEWLPDATLQAIAAENNLAETAYFIQRASGKYDLRWFTPALEIDLCGHATLAAAKVIFDHLETGIEAVAFETRSGELRVKRQGTLLELDFPARRPERMGDHARLAAALGVTPLEVWKSRDHLVVLESAGAVRGLKPDMRKLSECEDVFAVIVTGPGEGEIDFVSRFFAPKAGIDEDPVTGSAHCTLVPYWADRLGKTQLRARQVSARVGDLWCELRDGDRVAMAGDGVEYLRGVIRVG